MKMTKRQKANVEKKNYVVLKLVIKLEFVVEFLMCLLAACLFFGLIYDNLFAACGAF